MAEGGPDGGAAAPDELSFVERVRYMMYGEQEKEAFLIEKKEKEEKKKAKKALKQQKEAEKKAKKKKEAEKEESCQSPEETPNDSILEKNANCK